MNYNLGTFGYQAPELFRRGGRHDEKVDIWSTAVIAFLFLGGEQPFKRNGKISVTATIQDEPDFSSLWGFSGSALKFLRAGLTKDSSERPNADEMLDTLWLRGPNLCHEAGAGSDQSDEEGYSISGEEDDFSAS